MSKTNVHKTVSEMQKSAKTLLGEIKKTRHKTRDNIALFKGLQSEIKERDAIARRLAKEEAEEAAKAAVEVVEVALEDVTEVTTKADEPVTEVKEISPVKVEAKVEEKQEVVPPIVDAKKDEKPKKVETKAKKTTKVEEKKVVKEKVVEKKPEPPMKAAEPTVEKKSVQEEVVEKVKRPLQPPMTRMEELRQRNIKASNEAKANHERLKLERANAPKVEPKPLRPKTQGSGLGQPRRP